MIMVGALMVAGGGLALIGSVVLAAQGAKRVQVYGRGGYLQDRRSDEGMESAGIGLAIATAAICVAGIPVWAYGAHKVPIKQPKKENPGLPFPELQQPAPTAAIRLGAGTASFEMSF
jgi:hypothetical protein